MTALTHFTRPPTRGIVEIQWRDQPTGDTPTLKLDLDTGHSRFANGGARGRAHPAYARALTKLYRAGDVEALRSFLAANPHPLSPPSDELLLDAGEKDSTEQPDTGRASSSTAQRLFDAGYRELVSVTPPDAELTPNSRLPLDQRGKVPGKRNGAGKWHGYRWSKEEVPPEVIDETGANIGIRAEFYPALDIDSEDAGLTLVVRQEAERFLGAAPTRQSRAPRLLLMYRTDEPIKKQALNVLYKGQNHTIEFLAKGQQYLIHGTHPSGAQYRWDGPFPASPEDLTLVTGDKVREFLHHLGRLFEERGLDVEIIGAGKKTGRAEPMPEVVVHGGRNNTLASIAGTFRQRNLSKEAALQALLVENEQRCHPPLPADEVGRIVESIYGNYDAGVEPDLSTPDDDFSPIECAEPRQGGLNLTEVDDLDQEPDRVVRWLVEGLIPAEGASIVSAQPKVGKSTLARALAVAVTHETEWLGREVAGGPVIYLLFTGEGTRDALKREMRLLREGKRKKHPLFVYTGRAPRDVIRQLEANVHNVNPALVIVDTMQKVAQAKDLNDYAIVERAIEPILAAGSNSHVMFIHHAPKGASDNVTDMILGSTVIYGAMEVALVLWRDPNDSQTRYMKAEGRDVEMGGHVLRMDPTTHEPFLSGTSHTRKQDAIKASILATLVDSELERSELIGNQGHGQPRYEALKQLERDGLVQRMGAGRRGDPYRFRRIGPDDDFQPVQDEPAHTHQRAVTPTKQAQFFEESGTSPPPDDESTELADERGKEGSDV